MQDRPVFSGGKPILLGGRSKDRPSPFVSPKVCELIAGVPVLLIVHPSYPWSAQQDDDVWELVKAARMVRKVRYFFDRIAGKAQRASHYVLIGPDRAAWVESSRLPKATALHENAARKFYARSRYDFEAAAREIVAAYPGRRFEICGFWRDLCCAELEAELHRLGSFAYIDMRAACPAPY